LDEADLDTITAKKVRIQLETNLKTDLTKQRKEVDSLIMEILDERQNKSDHEEESEEEEKKNKPTKRRSTKKDSGSDDDSEPEGKKGKKAAKPAAKRAGTGYTKVCKLSPELAIVMGEDSMARHEVVKKMWKIVKEKNLYDPKNKQFAICNDELFAVFGIKRFRTFGMMKYLKNHFVD